MRLRDMGPGQLKQDDRGPHPLTRECLPAPRLELSIHGAGSWAGPRAERRAGGHAQCSRCLPSQSAWGGVQDKDGAPVILLELSRSHVPQPHACISPSLGQQIP